MDIVFPLFQPDGKNLPEYSGGVGYGPEWADRLVRGFRRNTSKRHRYICVSDQEYQYQEKIQTVLMDCNIHGWACIMECFRPDIGKSRRMILGLDTIILQNVDDILAWREECGLLRDPYETDTICNGVGIFSAAEVRRIWSAWQNRETINHTYKNLPSEMAFLRAVCPNAVRLDSVFPDQIQSYKAHWRRFPELQPQARIVYFHGTPKPPQVEPQLLEHWA